MAVECKTSKSAYRIATIEQLSELKTMDEQVEFLTNTYCAKSSETRKKHTLVAAIEDLMQKFFPGATVTMFGSSANNLAITGKSDVDAYLNVNFEVFNDSRKQNEDARVKKIVNMMRFFKAAEQDDRKQFHRKQFLNSVKGLSSSSSIIQIIGAIIRKFGRGCQRVKVIPWAMCPLVKFYHTESDMHFDLSIGNRLATENTKLLSFYQELDRRVHPLLFVLRFWCKSNNLCVDQATSKISAYVISLLVVCYLQNCDPPILPTVEYLQSLLGKKTKTGWNVDESRFCQDATKIRKTTNKDSIEVLLKGFFAYYTQIDFASNVICPWNGMVLSNGTFLKDYANNAFRFKKLNVQDPFQRNHNAASASTNELSEELYECITMSHEILNSDSRETSDGCDSRFAKMLYLVKDAKTQKRKRKPKETSPRHLFARVPNVSPIIEKSFVVIPIILNDDVLKLYPEIFNNENIQIGKSNRRKINALLARLTNLVVTIFEKVLQIRCVFASKRRKPDDGNALISSKVQILDDKRKKKVVKQKFSVTNLAKEIGVKNNTSNRFFCEVYHRIWGNFERLHVRNALDASQSQQPVLKSQELLTEMILQNKHVSNPPNQPIFIFECRMNRIYSEDRYGVEVKLDPEFDSNVFNSQFVPFLKFYLENVANLAFLDMLMKERQNNLL